MKPERAGLQEQIGRSVNSSHLEHRAERDTAVTQIGALGAAALHIHHGSDLRGEWVQKTLSRDGHAPDPQDVLAAELAVNLWHIRYAGQFCAVPNAVSLFARWMTYRSRFNAIADRAQLLPKLAARALHELLSERCTRCGGSGRLEVSASGNLVRGSGRMARNAVFRNCPVKNGCGGTGRPSPSHTERRIALGISRERYDRERWDAHIKAAMTWLSMRLSPRLNRPLTAQLDRSIKRD